MVCEELAEVLVDRAAWTRARLIAGRNHGVELHEETITQDLLLDISAALPALSVETFTKRQEARNGADWQWEWWFQGRQWFGLRVQAKRLKQVKRRQVGYDLGYRTGREHRRQVDLLIEDAGVAGAQAAYVLYNGPGLDISKFTWGCGRLPPSPAFFGVSLLPAIIARDLVDRRTVDLASVGALSRPWSCLVSCDPSSGCHWSAPLLPRHPGNDSGDLAWWAARSYFRIVMQASQAQMPISVDTADSTFDQDFLQTLQADPPPYVATLLNQRLQADATLPPRVGALTVFLAATIDQRS
jgi:hypothetical protein